MLEEIVIRMTDQLNESHLVIDDAQHKLAEFFTEVKITIRRADFIPFRALAADALPGQIISYLSDSLQTLAAAASCVKGLAMINPDDELCRGTRIAELLEELAEADGVSDKYAMKAKRVQKVVYDGVPVPESFKNIGHVGGEEQYKRSILLMLLQEKQVPYGMIYQIFAACGSPLS